MITNFEYEGLYYKDNSFLICVGIKSDITKAKLHENTEIIDSKAFECSNIKEIIFNENLQKIGDSAFAYSKIENINLPKSIKIIESYAFHNCHSLKKVNLANTDIRVLKAGTFYFCTGLENIQFPEKFTTIRDSCFEDCRKLKDIVLPDTVRIIDNRAFKNTAIENITIPPRVLELNNEAFCDCKKLNKINLNNVQEIYDNVFANNPNLKDIELPKSLKFIYMSAFENTGINVIILPSNINYLNINNSVNIHEIRYETLKEDVRLEIKNKCDKFGILFTQIDLNYLLDQGKSLREINAYYNEQER